MSKCKCGKPDYCEEKKEKKGGGGGGKGILKKKKSTGGGMGESEFVILLNNFHLIFIY